MARPLKISVVTPNWNCAEFIQRTLSSVLNQEYPDLEYVVVDGASTDSSLDIINANRSGLSAVISEPDQGHADAINKGFAVTDGEIMGWINSDDMLLPGSLAAVKRIFQDLPEVEWITGRATAITESDVVCTVREARPWSWVRLLGGDYRHIQQESTFWRRSLWEKAGAYVSTDYKLACDFELWTRFFRHAALYSADIQLGSFRFRRGQRSRASAELYDAECHSALSTLWEWLPATAIAEYADVLGAPYVLQPSFTFPAVSPDLAGADPPIISIDHNTETFAIAGVGPEPPRLPRASVAEERDLVFDDSARFVWGTGPDFAVSDFIGLEVATRSNLPSGQEAPAMPVLAGPLAIYDFGGGRYLVQLKFTERIVSTDILADPQDFRLKVVVARGRILIIHNGVVVHRGACSEEEFASYSAVPVLGTGSLAHRWSGEVGFVRATSRGRDRALRTHELRCLPQRRQRRPLVPATAGTAG